MRRFPDHRCCGCCPHRGVDAGGRELSPAILADLVADTESQVVDDAAGNARPRQCYLQGAVQPQRVARIRDSKSGQNDTRDRDEMSWASEEQPASVENRRGVDSHCFGLFLTMEKTTRACEASAFAPCTRRAPLTRHARPCAGHPRLSGLKEDVDGRDKPGHDGALNARPCGRGGCSLWRKQARYG